MPDLVVTFTDPPDNLVERLRPLLDAQGSPPIHARGADERICFTGDTGEFMLRARAADALSAIWPGWQNSARL